MPKTEVTPRTQTQPQRRPNSAQKRAANRERILRAAREVFGEHGFHGATIEEIADQAGLSNGAIYYNFASKGELFLALLEERTEERIEHMRASFAEASDVGSLRAALAAEARDATRSVKDSREWRLLVLEFIAYAARTPELAPKLQAHERRFKAALSELITQRLSLGEAGPAEVVDGLALVVTTLSYGVAVAELSDPGAVPEGLLGELLALLLQPNEGNPS